MTSPRRRTARGSTFPVICIIAGLWVGPAAAQQPATVGQGVNERFLSRELDTAGMATRFESEGREAFDRRHSVIAALRLRPGLAAADIGAGSGFYAALMAASVGPAGTVYAVEIAPNWIEHLTEKFASEGLDNVHVVQSTADSVNLPEGSLDLIFSSDTYHHFEDPPAILGSIHRALKPGGRWVVLDFDRVPGVTPPGLMEHLRTGKAGAIEENLSAGFELEREADVGLEQSYLAVFRRP